VEAKSNATPSTIPASDSKVSEGDTMMDGQRSLGDLTETPAWLSDWYSLEACSGVFVQLCECTRVLLQHTVQGTAEDWALIDSENLSISRRNRALALLLQQYLPGVNDPKVGVEYGNDLLLKSYGAAKSLRECLEVCRSAPPTQHELLHSGLGLAIGLFLGVVDINAKSFKLRGNSNGALSVAASTPSVPKFPTEAFAVSDTEIVARTLAIVRVLGGREALRNAES